MVIKLSPIIWKHPFEISCKAHNEQHIKPSKGINGLESLNILSGTD